MAERILLNWRPQFKNKGGVIILIKKLLVNTIICLEKHLL